jgi:hypothetical protein
VLPDPRQPLACGCGPGGLRGLRGQSGNKTGQCAQCLRTGAFERARDLERRVGPVAREPGEACRLRQRHRHRHDASVAERQSRESRPVAIAVEVLSRPVVDQRAAVEPDGAVVVGDDAEGARFAEEEADLVTPASSRADAARDDVRTGRSLRVLEGRAAVVIGLGMPAGEQDEVGVGPVSASGRPRRREHVAPGGANGLRVKACLRRPQSRRVREQRCQCVADRRLRRLDEHPCAILRRNELRAAALVAGEKGNPVLDALVHDVRRVVDERRHHRQRSG